MKRSKSTDEDMLLDCMLAYEQEKLSPPEIVTLFQILLDTGYVWKLQGLYGRQALCLLERGVLEPSKRTRRAE